MSVDRNTTKGRFSVYLKQWPGGEIVLIQRNGHVKVVGGYSSSLKGEGNRRMEGVKIAEDLLDLFVQMKILI